MPVAPLAGCGLHPLYEGGTHGAVAQKLAQAEIEPIGGQSGWLMRNALADRIGASGHDTPRYKLIVELDDQIVGLGIRSDNTVTRERRTLRARFRLDHRRRRGHDAARRQRGLGCGHRRGQLGLCDGRRRADRAGEPDQRRRRPDRRARRGLRAPHAGSLMGGR